MGPKKTIDQQIAELQARKDRIVKKAELKKQIETARNALRKLK